MTSYDMSVWMRRRNGDRKFSDVLQREENRYSNWNSTFVYDTKVVNTIASHQGSKLISFEEPKHLSNNELRLAGTFPVDYDFGDMDPKYVIGMSVPPVMMARISREIWKQWLSKLY